jgi:hypothetical protein
MLSDIRAMLLFDNKSETYLSDTDLEIVNIMPIVSTFTQIFDISWTKGWLDHFYALKCIEMGGKY